MKSFFNTTFLLVFLFTVLVGAFYITPDFRYQFNNQFFRQDSIAIAPKPREIIPQKQVQTKAPPHTTLWSRIDAIAVNAPEVNAHDIPSLVHYLCASSKTEWEKARSIFRWITEHISYDDDAYNSGKYGNNSAEDVLKRRKGVCDDFSELFKAMAEAAGFKAEKISGYAKGYGYIARQKFQKTDHAWNAIFIDDRWHLIDCTWAEGFGETKDGKLFSTKRFKDDWFDTPPSEFIFKHMPEMPQWQLFQSPISLQEYERMPMVGPEFFALGYDSDAVLEAARSGKLRELPTVWDHPFHAIATKAPARRVIPAETELELEFECADCQAMAVFNDGVITDLESKGNTFKAKLKPLVGPLGIYAKKKKEDKKFSGIMEFEVKKKLSSASHKGSGPS